VSLTLTSLAMSLRVISLIPDVSVFVADVPADELSPQATSSHTAASVASTAQYFGVGANLPCKFLFWFMIHLAGNVLIALPSELAGRKRQQPIT
jgi:hypothetical protein